MIGNNIRMRRKKLRLSQEALAQGDWTRSYISQIERGRIQPSIDTLTKIAIKLDTTVAELIGDQTLVHQAKAAVLYPDICKQYLDQLPETPTTIFLDQLTNSLLTNNNLDFQLPPNPELYYLTARVLIFQKKYPSAVKLLQKALKLFDIFWRILFMRKLYFVYQQLNDQEGMESVKAELGQALASLDSTDDLKSKLAQELKFESDPVRITHLSNFILAIEFGEDFIEAIKLANS
ncbi:MAG: helix-turn-helix domain-containing protein [Candidatus Wallacebacter cryptica]|jgi:transcriptional regulator with XRE-family HTH domain